MGVIYNNNNSYKKKLKKYESVINIKKIYKLESS